MLLIHKTVSLCDHCYRHIPANVYEDNGQILMAKNCPEHGIMHSVVETDPEFYYGLDHKKDFTTFNQVLFEVTDRCQLNCPHCYHLPDNKIKDSPLDFVIEQVKTFPKDCMPMFAGAEATLRKDFIELCKKINDLDFEEFSLISKLSNLIEVGYNLGYVGYTIESLDDVPEILEEIQKIKSSSINHYRIRCGSFIGRSLDKHRSYLSDLVKKVKSLLGDEVNFGVYDDNPYHVMMEWGDVKLRLIQWPDVTNIDMEELATGPWCQFYDGPITNFVHQVITRDAYKNMNMPKLDEVPVRYHYRRITNEFNDHHWKHHWSGTTKISKFDWTLDQDQKPVKIYTLSPV